MVIMTIEELLAPVLYCSCSLAGALTWGIQTRQISLSITAGKLSGKR
jgi:hypothetical protein